MSEDKPRKGSDPQRRRKLNSREVASADAPTQRIVGGEVRQIRPAPPTDGQAPSRGRRDATGAVGPRPSPPVNGPSPRPATNGQPRPNLAPRPAQRNDAAALVPPHVKSGGLLTPQPYRQPVAVRRRVIIGAVVAVGLIVLLAAWWALGRYQTFTNVVSHIQTTRIPQLPVATGGVLLATPGPNATPLPTLPEWTGSEPLTILLLGLDTRDDDTKPPRSDTMILVRIEPTTKKVAMLSIPRDLWVKIPEFDGPTSDRINAAYEYGAGNNVPGGGPAMAAATIRYNFGIQVDYYAEVDFHGFEAVVDALGGISIDVAKPLVDNEFPNGNNITRILIPAGLQTMDGKTALEFARSRHQDSDLGRNQRQQQVLLAIKQKGLDIFNTLAHADDLLNSLKGSVRTDLNSNQIVSLGLLARDIKEITQSSITADMVSEQIMDNGADVLVPDWEKIRPLIAKLFGGHSVQTEAARIEVHNGTHTAHLATDIATTLRGQGFNIVNVANDPKAGDYPKTVIYNYGDKPITAQELAKSLGVGEDVIKSATNGPPNVDILVILGDDKSSAQ